MEAIRKQLCCVTVALQRSGKSEEQPPVQGSAAFFGNKGKFMKLNILKQIFVVCKVTDLTQLDLSRPYVFLGVTADEISVVCSQEAVPKNAYAKEAGWKAFQVEGQLDFSLTGILSGIAGILAEESISIFALSTFDTDYVLVKEETLPAAAEALQKQGYLVEE